MGLIDTSGELLDALVLTPVRISGGRTEMPRSGVGLYRGAIELLK